MNELVIHDIELEIIEALEKAGRLDEAMAMENEHGRFR